MVLDLSRLREQERLSLQLQLRYEDAGFQRYRMGRFEEYALYAQNRSFLSGEPVLTFTDLDGRLMALKPDVTISIAKNAQVPAGGCGRFYYDEQVYRPSPESSGFREIRQVGLECIGAVTERDAAEAVALAGASLSLSGRPWSLELGHMGFVTGLFDAVGAPEDARGALLAAIRDKNAHTLRALALSAGLSRQGADALGRLLTLSGAWDAVLEQADALALNAPMGDALAELRTLKNLLGESPDELRLDLSLVNDLEYYNGLVFQGYLAGAPGAALRGGRYDPLVQRFRSGGAIGFALYFSALESPAPRSEAGSGTLSIALPKGRLGDKVLSLLEKVGCGAPEDYAESRKLVIENEAAGVRFFLVKPSDVTVYVEHGAADVGIAGKDILEESGADVFELLDTGLGRCRMCVAAPKGYVEDPNRPVRVATKFVNIAKRYYASQGRDIDIIKLNGSIELAPILGLSDVIVDIVESGTTLRENGLAVVKEFMPISARFIANRAACQFKRDRIDALLTKLREVCA